MANELGTLSPEDYAQQQAITRQQRMAEMLMSQNQQPQGQMISGRYVAPSFFQNLAPLVNTYVGKGLLEESDVKAAQLAEKLRTDENTALQNLLNVSKGTLAQQGGIYGSNGQITKATTADMYDANLKLNPQYIEKANIEAKPASQEDLIMAAAKLRDPSIRNMLVAERFKPKAPLTVAQGAAIITQNPDGTFTKSFENPKEIKYPEKIELALALDRSLPRDPSTWTQADADRANARIEKHIRASAPNMTSINNVMAFEPFANKVQSKMGEGLVENYANLKNIPTQIKSLDRAAQLAPKSFAGSMAEQKLGITKFFNNNLGTNISADKVKNTEELRSALFTNVMENLKKLDASPSQQQQQILQQSMGSIGTDPNAIPLVVNTYKQILIDKAKQHNLQVKQAQEGPAKLVYPYDISIPINEGGGEWRVK
jgi:hypothetical protein